METAVLRITDDASLLSPVLTTLLTCLAPSAAGEGRANSLLGHFLFCGFWVKSSAFQLFQSLTCRHRRLQDSILGLFSLWSPHSLVTDGFKYDLDTDYSQIYTSSPVIPPNSRLYIHLLLNISSWLCTSNPECHMSETDRLQVLPQTGAL
jgi:hypothetical protein